MAHRSTAIAFGGIIAAAEATASPVSPGSVAEGDQVATAAAPDFTHMSRQGLHEWMNGQIISGQMSLDDSTPFLAMTLEVPVDGTGLAGAALGTEPVDFVALARQGLEEARSLGDHGQAAILQKALAIMTSVGS